MVFKWNSYIISSLPYNNYRKMVRLDNIDVNILKFLRIDSRARATHLSKDLAKNGTIISSRFQKA